MYLLLIIMFLFKIGVLDKWLEQGISLEEYTICQN